jgi:uncharacterized protein DUF2865
LGTQSIDRGHQTVGAVTALAVLMVVLASVFPASAGILDFLFGAPQGGQGRYAARQQGPQQVPQQAPPGLFAPLFGPPATTILITPGIDGGTGQYVAYCVRLCDGRYFPMQRSVVAQSTQICQNLCPASKTKVLSGTEIGNATAIDGTRYDQLVNAFAYRERIVPGCTCNGREPFGMATMKIEDDPTLVPGDLVATKDGLARYTGFGRNPFTPIETPSASKRKANGQYATTRFPR